MLAIYKRELRSYFTSPIGYIFIAGFLAISGFLFSLFTVQNALDGQKADLAGYYQMVMYLMTVFLPILTMKSFSEEKKQKTEQLLLTSPVRIGSIVGAKFLAAYTVFSLTYLVTLFDYAVIALYATEDSLVVTDAFVVMVGYSCAFLLIGAAFLAVGIFISTLTENQIIAAIASIAVLLFLSIVNMITPYIDFAPLREIIKFFSIYSRFVNFTRGIFDFAALLYYACICGVFLFMSTQVYERRRWA